MSSLTPLITFIVCLFSSAPATAYALPRPTEAEQDATRSSGHAPRSTTTTAKTGMPAWQIAVIALGLFFGIMAIGMCGGALEVLLHTRKKVADPDPAPSELDFGARGAGAEGEKEIKEGEEGEDTDDDGATAVEGSADGDGGDKNEKPDGRFSWQDEQGVQFEVWNENAAHGAEKGGSDPGHATHDGTSTGYPQQPEQAYGGAQYEGGHQGQHYPQYQHEAVEAHDEVQDVHGQRMTRYEAWVPQMDENSHNGPLPAHGSQSETTHQQHPAEYI